MLSALYKKLHLTPSAVIATLALVLAMTGGAYAAKQYLITSTKQISPKVLSALKGNAGPAGKSGANGVTGAKGEAGPAGIKGEKGEKGERGEKGETGKDGEEGERGPRGQEGKPGAPGAIHPGETLPTGATETGTWTMTAGVNNQSVGGAIAQASISFAIPLADTLEGSNIKVEPVYLEEEEKYKPEPECPSTLVELTEGKAAKAGPGFLCVYTVEEYRMEPAGFVHPIEAPLSSANGVILSAVVKEANENVARSLGYWAVTAG